MYKFCIAVLLATMLQNYAFAQQDSIYHFSKDSLDEIVVTGTKTFKRKTNSAVMVHVLNSKTLSNLQVCNLADGLKFQPGLRVETNCQTCNYTQLRMNGLQGGFSQILINGRPIFSALMSLYGMEQLPVNMIERIEVVRGGGSSLYGSSAIGGTVNVITKLPQKNSAELHSFYQSIAAQTGDFTINANLSGVSKNKKTGAAVFLNHRKRGMFDRNGDHFSEMPALNNAAAGLNFFTQPNTKQKLEISLSYLNEYRYGGDMQATTPHLAQQAEERKHQVWMMSADYQINFNQSNSSFITYAAMQQTNRQHYTGVFPDSAADIQQHLVQPPYGHASNTTTQAGFQLNHRPTRFFKGNQVFTLGSEYNTDQINDQISAYNYSIRQQANNWGSFLQSDWNIWPKLNLLSGVRADKHNLLQSWMFSPRVALLYKFQPNTQLRLNYGTGFRAPQAFDTDLHMAFANGGVSRVQIAPNLQAERSMSYSGSFNYDYSTTRWIAGFTVEAFYTKLQHAFVLTHIGQDSFGEIFEKQNGSTAMVQGITIELRGNYQKKIQVETGFTLQKSQYEQPVTYIQNAAATKHFLRTPNQYGYATLNITPNNKWSCNLNYVYTGAMQIAHFGGADNFPNDAMVTSQSFSEVNLKISRSFHCHKQHADLECYIGGKNIFNQYQQDFDIGKNRDSNYIYGPNQPATIFFGIKIKPE